MGGCAKENSLIAGPAVECDTCYSLKASQLGRAVPGHVGEWGGVEWVQDASATAGPVGCTGPVLGICCSESIRPVTTKVLHADKSCSSLLPGQAESHDQLSLFR